VEAERYDSLLPDLDHFEQQVIQADLDRDPFAIALFEIKPVGNEYSSLLPRLARRLIDFASPSTHVASLGNGRLAILARTNDTTHRWVAPVSTALQAALDEWLDESEADGRAPWTDRPGGQALQIADLVSPIDVSDLMDRPRLISGAARGLTQEVWLNAEAALAKAHKRQLSFVEHRGGVDSPSIADRRALADPAEGVPEHEPANGLIGADDDERLVVLSHRLEPVGRPTPEWLWLRLEPGLQPLSDGSVHTINLDDLTSSERAMLEIWLAGQIGPLFSGTSAQLRVTLPITAEAGRARSFAQRIFPVLEQHRIPPSRLVLEIDAGALVTEPDAHPDAETAKGSQPSVRRFVDDAASMDVSVVVANFDGGWASWRAIQDLSIEYIKPPADLFRHAAAGDGDAIRTLDFLGADADDRGFELIVPDVGTELAPEFLSGLGFSYQESAVSTVSQTLASLDAREAAIGLESAGDTFKR